MTIALTGATGFVGRHVLRDLTRRGLKVRAIVRNPERLTDEAASEMVEIATTSDLFTESPAGLRELLTGVDTLVHCAWHVQPGSYANADQNITCLQGTLEIARVFAQLEGSRFVGIGSCAEYQASSEPLAVDSPLAPQSLYASTKVASYLVLQKLLAEVGTSFAWCRLFYLYGEGENERRLLPYLNVQLASGREALLSSGHQIRDYMNVVDAGRLIADVVIGDQQGPFNVCSGLGISIRDLAESVADKYGRRDLLRFGAKLMNPFDPPIIVGLPGGVKGFASDEGAPFGGPVDTSSAV